jgi:hypothetical protein
MLRFAIVASLTLLLGACGATLGSALLLPPGSTTEYFAKCLKANGFIDSETGASLSSVQQKLTSGLLYPRDGTSPADRMLKKGWVNLYLDCYLAPVEQTDIEGRLLRGHIVLTLLAQYGSASLVMKDRASKPDDAIAMQGHIRRAQFQLLSVSPAGLRGVYGLDGKAEDGSLLIPDRTATMARTTKLISEDLPNFHNARRVAAVFDVGLDIMRVDGRYIASLAGSVFDIVSGTIATGGLNPGTVSKLQDLMGGVAQGMQLAALNQWYGSAFIADAELSILVSQNPPSASNLPYYRDVSRSWFYWQKRLDAACDGLNKLAGEKKTTCLPTAGEMADFIEAEFGADHGFIKPLRIKAKDEAARKAAATK